MRFCKEWLVYMELRRQLHDLPEDMLGEQHKDIKKPDCNYDGTPIRRLT